MNLELPSVARPETTIVETPSRQHHEVILVSHGFGSNYERGFVNGLARNRAAVTLISSDRTDYAGLRPEARTINLRGSQEEKRPRLAKLGNMLRYHAALMAHVFRNRQAVVHVIGLLHPPLLCGLIEGLYFRALAAKYVLTVHDLLPHDRHTPFNRWLSTRAFRIADHLVVHTRRMRSQLVEDFGIAADKITVMEHGIEPLTGPLAAPPRRAAGPRIRFLFFGVVAPYKGLDILLSALEALPGSHELHIMGRAASDRMRQEIGARIAQQPTRHSIVWRDEFIPEADLAGIFESADVLVLPYRAIDQSGVLFQALRFGLPIIASRVGSFEDYVTQEVGLIVPPENADALRTALERFVGTATAYSRTRIAEIGRGFEWPVTVQALDPIYQRQHAHEDT